MSNDLMMSKFTTATARRVVCGMSGGVDSSVAAFLLKKKGYEVVGLFMKNWDIANEQGKCMADSDRNDAEYVCDKLGIPFHEVNFVKEYWNEVFSSFVKDYESGMTPNPDILCNKFIKFDRFFNHAISSLGADNIATGHYARLSGNPSQGVKLLQAVDEVKDQTFFLSQISQASLQKTVFPLGELNKNEVKQIAMEVGLEKIAKKKESMGICFVGSRNFHRFIEEYIEPKPGDFIDVATGKLVGRHKGTHYWTIGQRALIAGQKCAYFVASRCPQTRTVIVAPGTDHPALFTDSFQTGPPHWIHAPPHSFSAGQVFHAEFRFQHKHPLIRCKVSLSSSNNLVVSLDQPMRALAPGQFAVFYQGDECLGSARILKPGISLFHRNQTDRVKIPAQFF